MKEIDTGRQEQTTLHSLTDQLQLSVKAKGIIMWILLLLWYFKYYFFCCILDTEPSEELTEQMKDKGIIIKNNYNNSNILSLYPAQCQQKINLWMSY